MSWKIVSKNAIYRKKKQPKKKLKDLSLKTLKNLRKKKQREQKKKDPNKIKHSTLVSQEKEKLESWEPPTDELLKEEILSRRKKLLKKVTKAEKVISRVLTKAGFKFETERPFVTDAAQKYYIFADFYIPEYKIAIEVDGGYHQEEKQKTRDNMKDLFYSSNGIKIIRMDNNVAIGSGKNLVQYIMDFALETNPDSLIRKIYQAIVVPKQDKSFQQLQKEYKEFLVRRKMGEIK